MEPAKWEQIRDRLLFVHDRLNGDDLNSRIVDLLSDTENDEVLDDESLTDEISEACERGTPRASFAGVAQLLATRNLQFKKLGTLKRPVEADVYSLASSGNNAKLDHSG